MGYGLKYRMRWKTPEDQLVMVKIYDSLAEGGNPLNMQATVVDNGDGTMTVTFTWNALPGNTVSAVLGYSDDNGATWTENAGSQISPRTWTIPTGDYLYRVTVFYSDAAPDVYVIEGERIEDLTPSGVAFELSVIDNDEDIHKVVRAKQAIFRFLNDSNLSLRLFTGPRAFDFRWYVTVELNVEGRFIFKGFLILDDMSEPFLAPREEVVLTATDRLGTLKNAALQGFNNANPRDYSTIAQYLAMVLRKTGLNLPINVQMNIKEIGSAPIITSARFLTALDTISVPFSPFWRVGKQIRVTGSNNNDGLMTITGVANFFLGLVVSVNVNLVDEDASGVLFEDVAGHMFNRIYIEAKTWEANINESEDGYTVIEKLLGELCYITQEKGEWWIKRIDETNAAIQQRITVFDTEGTFVEDKAPADYDKQISRTAGISFVKNETKVFPTRPNKHINLTLRYAMPLEIPCNVNYLRGDFIANLDDVVIEGRTYAAKKYNIDCWEYAIHKSNGNANVAANGSAYIKRLFYNDTETQRFIRLDRGATVEDSLKSEHIYVTKDTKVNVGVSARYSNDTDQVTRNIALELVGDDGTFWYALQFNNRLLWFQYPAGNNPIIFISNPDIDENDYTSWNSVSYESNAVPVSGKLYFYLYLDIVSGMTYVEYNDLEIEILHFINGSYIKYVGQENKVTQVQDTDQYNAVHEKEIFMGEPPSKLFKGAMTYLDGTEHYLADRFYDANLYPDPNVDEANIHSFGWLQAFDVFNQYNRAMIKYRAVMLGLSGGSLDALGRADVPGLTQRYFVNDASPFAMHKNFQLMSFVQDFETCEWRGTMREVNDDMIPKVYEGHTFKYVEK